MIERPATADLIIREMCREKWMTEEQLLVHLAVEHANTELSNAGQRKVLRRSTLLHRAGVFVVRKRNQ